MSINVNWAYNTLFRKRSMEFKTVYEAVDGMQFTTQEACEAYEAEGAVVAEIIGKMPCPPSEETEYVQLDADTVLDIKHRLWARIIEQYGADFPTWDRNADNICMLSGPGALASKLRGHVAAAWSILQCVNFTLMRLYCSSEVAMNPQDAYTRIEAKYAGQETDDEVLKQMLSDVTAALETLLAHHGTQMSKDDYRQRLLLVESSFGLLDKLHFFKSSGPEPGNE